MAIQGRGRRGGGQNNNLLPPALDQQAFTEANGVAATTIAQTSATVGQGGPSNLQRFKAHHPHTFKGEGELIEVDHCSGKLERS